jgi:hypothetical protein
MLTQAEVPGEEKSTFADYSTFSLFHAPVAKECD